MSNPASVSDLVSVIIPTWNRADLIGMTLDSVFGQSYRPIEVIVVDDGSTDGTGDVVGRYMTELPTGIKMSYFQQAQLGAQVARNRGIREAHGEYLQFLDSDDLLEQDKLSSQMAAFADASRSCSVVYGDFMVADTGVAGNLVPLIRITRAAYDDKVEALLFQQMTAPFAYLFRRSAVTAIGGWDESLEVSQDFDLLLRMAVVGVSFRYVAGVAGVHRLHAGPSITSMHRAARTAATWRILERAESELSVAGQMTRWRAFAIVDFYMSLGRKGLPRDPRWLRDAVAKAHLLCPSYLPPSGSRRILVRFFGLFWGEWLGVVAGLPRRVLRRILPCDRGKVLWEHERGLMGAWAGFSRMKAEGSLESAARTQDGCLGARPGGGVR